MTEPLINRAVLMDCDERLSTLLLSTAVQQSVLEQLGVIPCPATEEDKDRWTAELCSKLIGEVVELSQAVGWKTHRVVKKDPDKDSKVLDEFVDCLKYLLVIAHLRGITQGQIVQHYRAKTVMVVHRALEKAQTKETSNG